MMTVSEPVALRSTIPARLDGTSRTGMVWGYVIGGLIIVTGGVVELLIGIKAEGQSLETVTKPLTAVSDGESGQDPASGGSHG